FIRAPGPAPGGPSTAPRRGGSAGSGSSSWEAATPPRRSSPRTPLSRRRRGRPGSSPGVCPTTLMAASSSQSPPSTRPPGRRNGCRRRLRSGRHRDGPQRLRRPRPRRTASPDHVRSVHPRKCGLGRRHHRALRRDHLVHRIPSHPGPPRALDLSSEEGVPRTIGTCAVDEPSLHLLAYGDRTELASVILIGAGSAAKEAARDITSSPPELMLRRDPNTTSTMACVINRRLLVWCHDFTDTDFAGGLGSLGQRTSCLLDPHPVSVGR